MDKIENLNLTEIIETTATAMLEEKRKSVGGLVKQMLQAAEQAASDIKGLEKELEKKKQKLGEITGKVNKLKAGDWSVLQEAQKPKQQPQLEASGDAV